jgi:uncharacterized protein YbaP (TraB family)
MRRMNYPRLVKALLLVLGTICVQAAIAEQDQGLFWTIENDQGHAGYLLGTIHSEDPRVLEYTEDFLAALSSSSQFAMELVPDLATLAKLAETMNLPEGIELASIIGEQRFEAVATALSGYGVPRFMVARMKPWAAIITLSVPAPETGFFMDFSLSLRASGNGLKVIGLETLQEQLGFLENMPIEHQIMMLDQAVLEIDQVQGLHDRMVETYLGGDLSILHAETESQLSTLGEPVRDYFVAEGITARNQRMLTGLLEALDAGTVFTAVGALHLPGEQGLIALLRASGYRLRPMPSPFPPGE